MESFAWGLQIAAAYSLYCLVVSAATHHLHFFDYWCWSIISTCHLI